MLAPIVNHLWQSTLFTVVCAIVVMLLRNDGARARYWLWLAASVKYLIPFSLLAALGQRLADSTPSVYRFTEWSSAIETVARPMADASASQVLTAVLLGVWACGSMAVLYRWLIQSAGLRSLLRCTQPYPVAWPQSPVELPVRSSRVLMEPAIVGVFRPVLVLPHGIEARLTRAQLEAVIAHEVCHWRRRDNLSAALHRVVEAVFWFHPFVWWIGARLVDERERACDEVVVGAGHDREDYAEAILRVCESYVAAPSRCAAGVAGADLKQRITSIMRSRHMIRLTAIKKSVLAGAAFAAVAVPVLSGVLTDRSAFAQDEETYLPIVKVAPVYPARAAQRGLDGYVVVEYTVTTTGSVSDAFVVESSSSLFEEAALESARKYKYEPRIVNGAPVEVPGVQTIIRFELE